VADDLKSWLDELYLRFNNRRFVSPDPLASLYRYDDVRDREIAGLLAAGLAYGNVKSIVASVERLLARFGPSPRKFVDETDPGDFAKRIGNFRHRWTTADEVANLLAAVRAVCARHGSLGAALRRKIGPDDNDIQPAFTSIYKELCDEKLSRSNSLVADPAKPSASKRTHLFLRWMVRCDAVDPGGWDIPPRLLLMPVDVHIHRIAKNLRFTRRRAADLRTAREITSGFRRIAPDDPVIYDFALTRLPLHEGVRGRELAKLIESARQPAPK
jgi:uncharacterized protein (TIGR02757 family)